jgi:hypothetical protein
MQILCSSISDIIICKIEGSKYLHQMRKINVTIDQEIITLTVLLRNASHKYRVP